MGGGKVKGRGSGRRSRRNNRVAGVAEGEGATSIEGVARGQSDDGSRKGRVERGK